jgi:hypothetical protein
MVELAFVLSLAVPMFFGLTTIGVRLGRGLSATQTSRDVAHMYALGSDFSLSGTQAIAQALSRDFTVAPGGNAVFLLSRVSKVYQTDCTAAGLANCPNLEQTVFQQRIAFGNTTLRSSSFGTPPPAYLDAKGNITAANYCAQPSLIASGFNQVIGLAQGQVAWVVEGYFALPSLVPGQQGGYYVRFVL